MSASACTRSVPGLHDVNRITQKVVGGFSRNLGIARLWTSEELIEFWNVM